MATPEIAKAPPELSFNSKADQNVQILQLEVDSEGGEGEYRILVDGKFIKYVSIDGGLYDADDMCFTPVFVPQLPPLPPGDWNVGRISKDLLSGKPHFGRIAKEILPTITHLWHPTKIDHLTLSMDKHIRSNIYEVTSSEFQSTVIAKWARFPWETQYLDKETEVYGGFQVMELGPNFSHTRGREGHWLPYGENLGLRTCNTERCPALPKCLGGIAQVGNQA